ncbi:hypothetical protein [Bradyrhizobium sp. AZCC 1693]|uniref:hypothetical protein n=1 Tax=Bradyrhizobium sp. AZCC 1693 TaxID=3117029 RepID=UPI002FEF7537
MQGIRAAASTAFTEEVALLTRWIRSHLPTSAAGYNLLNNRLQISAAFAAGSDSFVTTAFSQSPWLYSASIGLASQRTEKLDLSVRYGVQASPSGSLNQTGSFTLRIKL